MRPIYALIKRTVYYRETHRRTVACFTTHKEAQRVADKKNKTATGVYGDTTYEVESVILYKTLDKIGNIE